MENKDASDLRTPTGDFVNVGTGKECTIKKLAETVEDVVYARLMETRLDNTVILL